MTPLAHQILRQLLLPAKRQTFRDLGGLLPLMRDVHYFDCRAVAEAASELLFDPKFEKVKEATAFLPAPKTWIEIKKFGIDVGVLLTQGQDYVEARLAVHGGTLDAWKGTEFESRPTVWRVPFIGVGILDFTAATAADGFDLTDRVATPIYLNAIAGCLALINSPRTIGRKTHKPHAGLQRDIARKFKGSGEFRLHPWTEILLRVSPRLSVNDPSSPRDVHLSGAKALHFVRKYLRIRNGRLETVSDHWRGDASLGIKQSTYRMVPGSGAEQE